MTTAVDSQPATASPLSGKIRDLLNNQQFVLAAFMVVLIAFFSLKNPQFWSQSVMENVLNDWSPLVLIAIGQTLVVISGGIDLSVGANIAMSGVVGALLMRKLTLGGQGANTTMLLGVLVAMAVGATVGCLNALLINKAKLVPFVATLATLSVCKGFAVVWTKGGPVGDSPTNTIPLTLSRYGPFSIAMLVVFVVVALAAVALHLTRFGRYTFAIGSSPFAARVAGVNVQRHLMKVYMISGALAGLAGIVYYLRLQSGSPSTGIGRELDSVAAVVIGGVFLTGGVGRIMGATLGTLVLSTVASGLVIIGVPANYRDVVVGVLIALAGVVLGLRKAAGKASS
jgi:ribose transport system permease protein